MITGIRTHITIGNRIVVRCPHLWIESERHRPLTRAGIVLPDADRTLFRSVREGEVVSISLGYRDRTPARYVGTVSRLVPGKTKDQVTVGVAGPELPLAQTRIVQSWENETPEAIVAWAVGRAGMEIGRIDSPGAVLPRFSAGNNPVWEVVRSVAHTLHRGHGIDMSRWALWVDGDGRVMWGDFEDAGEVPVIGTGARLIRHTPDEGSTARHTLETFLVPGLRHSMLFGLDDAVRGVSGRFRALSVRHEVGGHRARTFIKWGEEHEQF